MTADGFFSMTFKRTNAGPCGVRSPLSQCLKVEVEKPNRAANCSCVIPIFARTALTSTGRGRWTLMCGALPSACAMASINPALILSNALVILICSFFPMFVPTELSISPIHFVQLWSGFLAHFLQTWPRGKQELIHYESNK